MKEPEITRDPAQSADAERPLRSVRRNSGYKLLCGPNACGKGRVDIREEHSTFLRITINKHTRGLGPKSSRKNTMGSHAGRFRHRARLYENSNVEAVVRNGKHTAVLNPRPVGGGESSLALEPNRVLGSVLVQEV